MVLETDMPFRYSPKWLFVAFITAAIVVTIIDAAI